MNAYEIVGAHSQTGTDARFLVLANDVNDAQGQANARDIFVRDVILVTTDVQAARVALANPKTWFGLSAEFQEFLRCYYRER
jgi:hypothetical protein